MNTMRLPHSIITVLAVLLITGTAFCSATAEPSAPQAPLTPMGQVDAVLKLTPPEADALFATQAIPTPDFDTAVYMLLKKATELPQLDQADFDRLFRPEYTTLLTNPEPYVGRPIRLDVYIGEVVKYTSGVNLTPSADWPAGQDVWMILCYNVHSEVGDQGLQIYSVVDPMPLLPKATQTKDIGGVAHYRWSRKAPPKLSVAGIFVKVFRAPIKGADWDERPDPSDVEIRDFPLVIVWQIADPNADANAAGNWDAIFKAGLIAFVAALGLGVFIYMNMRIRRDRPAATRRGIGQLAGYKSLRGEGPVEEEFFPEDEDADAIDPELKAAVEGWKKDHHEPAD